MKFKNKIIPAILAVQMLLTCGAVTQAASVPAIPSDAQEIVQQEVITPRKDKIVWRYKTVDGQVYRRQYNATKNQWIGDWELY